MVRRSVAGAAVVTHLEEDRPGAPGDAGGCFGFLFGLAVAFSLLFRSRSVDTAGEITQRSIFCSKAASESVPESESGLELRSPQSEPPLGW